MRTRFSHRALVLRRKNSKRRRRLELLEYREMLAANLSVLGFDAPTAALVGNGEQISVSWTVKNTGDTAASHGWNDGLYFSDDAVFDPLIDQRFDFVIDPAVVPLDAGNEYTIDLSTVVVPESEPGNRFIILVADDQQTLGDPDFTDNVFVLPIELNEPDVDLSVANLRLNGLNFTTPPYQTVAGEPFVVDFLITSVGTDWPGAYRSESLYLSTDSELDFDDLLISDFYTDEIGPQHHWVSVPSDTPAGDYFLIVETNSNFVQSEVDYENNTAPVAMHVADEGPEFATTSENLPTIAVIGSLVSFDYLVTNTGSATAPMILEDIFGEGGGATGFDAIYLSSSPVFDPYDDANLAVEQTTVYTGDQFPLAVGSSYTASVSFAPSGVAAGDYYLHIVPDAFGYQPLINRVGAVLSSPITLTASDLAVTIATSVSTAILGSVLDVNYTVSNVGTEVAGQQYTYDSVYFSDDDVLDPADDLYLHTEYVDSEFPLAPSESYSRTVQVDLSQGHPGNHYLLVVADGGNGLSEANEDNNVFALPIEFFAPDLSVTEFFAPSEAILGDTITVDWTVLNDSDVDAPAGSRFDRFYLSDDDQFDPLLDSWIANVDVGSQFPLAGHDMYSQTADIRLSSGSITNHYLIVVADGFDQQPESDEFNNALAIPITLTAPDLIVTQLNPLGNLSPGAPYSVDYSVMNQSGTTALGDWYDALYLSPNPTLDAAAIQIDYQLQIAPGDTYDGSFFGVLPLVAPGTYYLIAKVNDFGLPETDTTNNTLSVTVTIGAPDLTVTDFSGPSTATLGTSIVVSYTVLNDSILATTATGWSDRFFLSVDETFDPAVDVPVDSEYFNNSPVLGPNGSHTTSSTVSLFAGDATMQYLIVVADGYDDQPELREDNNTRAIPITLTGPDLVIGQVLSSPASAFLSGDVFLSWQGQNIGPLATSSTFWSDYVYLSDDMTFSPGTDLYVGSAFRSGAGTLDANGTYTLSVTGHIPVNAGVGDKYLLFVADGSYSQAELNENNNVVAVGIQIMLPDVNLRPINPVIPSTVNRQSTFTINYDIANQGTQSTTATSWLDGIYLSTDMVLGGDTFLSFKSISTGLPIAGGSSLPVSTSVTLPASVAAGNYYLLIRTDGGNAQAETNNGDNVLVVPIQVTAELPDLVVMSQTAPAATHPGQRIDVSWTVRNQGVGAAESNWTDRVYLSPTPRLTAASRLIASQSIDAETPLATNGIYTINKSNILVPSNLSPGGYFVLIVTDSNAAQVESDESNNLQSASIVVDASDVVVLDAHAPATVFVNQSFGVDWTVKNIGPVSTEGAFGFGLYISDDATLDVSDSFLFLTTNSVLAAGATGFRSSNTTLGIQYVGDKFLLFVTDPSNNLGEIDDSNNTLAVPVSVVGADLRVDTVTTGQSSALIGDTITIDWTVQNLGPAVTDKLWVDQIYFSSDTLLDASDLFLGSRPGDAQLAVNGSYAASTTVQIPGNAGLVPGDYYVLVLTNGTISQSEVNFANNLGVSELLYLDLPAIPDLQVIGNGAPASVSLGEAIALTWTVQNNGNGDALADWIDRVYISSDMTLDVGDTLLAQETIAAQTPLTVGMGYPITKTVVVPATETGSRYLLFVADASAEQIESNEANNIAARPVDVLGVDLVVDSVVPAVSTVRFGETIDLTYTVRNAANGTATQDWNDRIYLSANSVFDASDVELIDFSVASESPLGPDGTYTRTVSVPIFVILSESRAPGNYRLLVKTDDDFIEGGQQPEIDEANNTGVSGLITLAPPLLPDLQVAQILGPTEGRQGQSFNLHWILANEGTAAAVGPWTDLIYLSTDPVLSTDSDQILGSFAFFGSLAPGEQVERAQSIVFPETLGEYYLFVVTDANGNVYEGANETNNVAMSETFPVLTAPRPDLVISNINVPTAAVLTGQTIAITYTVTNVGDAPTSAPYWQDVVFIDRDPAVDFNTGDQGLGVYLFDNFVPVPAVLVPNAAYLNPNESYTQTVEITLREDLIGIWYAYVVADGIPTSAAFNAGRVVEHAGENNLSRSVGFNVALAPPPDLKTTVVAPAITFSGQPLDLSWTVTNDGDGRTASSAWTDSVYLSTNHQLDAADQLLGEFPHDGSLNPGDFYTVSGNVTLPIGIAGDYYFLVQTDSKKQIYEHVFEDNNVGSDATQINLTPPPDLEVSLVNAPAAVLAGHSMVVSYQVTNNGSTATPTNLWTDAVYLSTDASFDPLTDERIGEFTHFGTLDVGGSYNNTINAILPDGISGDFYVFVRTDDAHVVFELNNTNNAASNPQPVAVTSRPADLYLETFAAPSQVTAGIPFLATWTVRNIGLGDSAVDRWTDKIYLSFDSLVGDDILLSSTSHRGLMQVGEVYTQSAVVVVPLQFAANDYRIYVRTDAAMTVDEDGSAATETGPGGTVFEGTLEANNNSLLRPLGVLRQTSDLVVQSVVAPVTALTGQTVTVSWTVANVGAIDTPNAYWLDDVYLSPDDTIGDANDIFLGSRLHSAPLNANANYSQSLDVVVPQSLIAGNYRFVVRADRPSTPPGSDPKLANLVLEDVESNNSRLAGITQVSESPVPDLAVTMVDAPPVAYSGRELSVTWAVANQGADTEEDWVDSVYLSLDQIFDPADRPLGSVARMGGLLSGDVYTQTASLPIPAGVAGTFYVFVFSDSTKRVFERGAESNNIGLHPLAVSIRLAAPIDLVAGEIIVPVNATPGQNASVTYTVYNDGSFSAIGGWEDRLYLSADTTWDIGDHPFARITHSDDVAAGGSYSETVTAPLPGLLPGSYYLIIRSDIRNQVVETDESNNLAASIDQTIIDVPALTLGVASTGKLQPAASVFYKVEVGADSTLRIALNSSSNTAVNELLVSFGHIPDRSNFDFAFRTPYSPDQEIVIPRTQAGTYYILAQCTSDPSGASPFSLLAEILPFSIRSVAPASVGNSGPVTLQITGAKFDHSSAFQLVDANGGLYLPTRLFVADAATAYATFDLTGAAPGSYAVHGTGALGEVSQLDVAITVDVGLSGVFEVEILSPDRFIYQRPGQLHVGYVNSGGSDLIAPLVIVKSITDTPFGLAPETIGAGPLVQALAISFDGPAGVLRPGTVNEIPLYLLATTQPRADFTVEYITADSTETLNWDSIESQIRPANVSAEDWDAAFARIRARVGDTWGGLVRALAEVATLLSERGERVYDPGELFGFLYDQEAGVNNSVIDGRVLLDETGAPLANVRVWADFVDPNAVDPFIDGDYTQVRDYAEGEIVFLRHTMTDANGEFRFTDLRPGSYKLYVTGYVPTELPDYMVSHAEDVYGVEVRVTPSPDEGVPDEVVEEVTSIDVQPVLALDSTGRTHIVWEHENMLWHAVNDGSGWINAAPIPSTNQAIDARFVIGHNLIDGVSEGLLVSWIAGLDNETEIYYVVGRLSDSGEYEWSAPVQVTHNEVKDHSFDVVIDDDGRPLFVWDKSLVDETGTDDDDTYFKFLSIVAPEFLSQLSNESITLSADDLALAEALMSSQDEADSFDAAAGDSVRLRFAIRDVFTIPLPGIGSSPSVTVRGEAFAKKTCEEIVGNISLDGLIKLDDENEALIKGGIRGRLANDQGGEPCDCDGEYKPKDASFSITGGLNQFIDVIQILPQIPPPVKAILKDKLKAGLRIEHRLEGRGTWFPSDEEKDWARKPDEFSIRYAVTGGLQTSVDVPLGWFGALKGVTRYTVGPFAYVWNSNNPSGLTVEDLDELQFCVFIRLDPKLNIFKSELLPDDIKKKSLGFYVDLNKCWRAGDILGFDEQMFSASDVMAGLEGFDEVTVGLREVLPGSLTDYSDADGTDAVLGTLDDMPDGPVSLTKAEDGTIYAAWANQDGVTTWRNVGGAWESIGIIPDTVDLANENVKLQTDGSGRVMAVWSIADYSAAGLSETSTAEEIFAALTQGGDLVYATFDAATGTWSSPSELASQAGKEYNLTIGRDTAGNLVASWLTSSLPSELPTLYVTTWDHASGAWSAVQALRTAAILDTTAVTTIAGQPVLVWSEDTSQPGTRDGDADIMSSMFVNGAWTSPDTFTYTLTAGTAAASAVTATTASTTDEFSAAEGDRDWFKVDGPLTPDPDCCDSDDCSDNDNPKPPPNPPSGPPGTPGGAPVVNSHDPNDIRGPEGFAEERWYAQRPLNYDVLFENLVDATADAQKVVIQEQLDEDLDFRTFRFGDFGWGSESFSVPANASFLSQRIDLRETRGFFVDVTGSIDVTQGLVTWTITTIDPDTGELPSDGSGFLPPDIDNLIGEGFVSYSVQAKPNAATGTTIDAQASITFEPNAPIDTPVWTNTLDLDQPTSSVMPLTADAVDNVFPVAWSGSDPEGGSGLASFDIYVSINGGAYLPWLSNTTLRQSLYIGVAGAAYQFFSVARDNAGNVEALPSVPDAVTAVPGLPGILVTPTSGLETTEAGSTASFSIVLASRPTALVTIDVASSRPTEGTASVASVTFTPDNFDTPQTVTVTGRNDFIDDGDQAYSLMLGPVTSSDADYIGIDPDDVQLVNSDDDSFGVQIVPTSGSTDENGTSSFTVVLTSEPTANVVLPIQAVPPGLVSVSQSGLTFTSLDWNLPQTVVLTGLYDFVDTGDRSYTISIGPATSEDSLYNDFNPSDVVGTLVDIDIAGISVSAATTLMTDENGRTDSFSVVLTSMPTSDVRISIASSDDNEASVSVVELVFTVANWNVAQTVTVTGKNDDLQDGDVPYTVIIGAAISDDAIYSGRDPDDLMAINADNDVAGFDVRPRTGLVTTEAGGKVQFTVALLTAPLSTVTLPIASLDPGEGTPDQTMLTFTPENWNVAQIVEVTGANDNVDDDDQVYSILLGPGVSADPDYNALAAGTVSLINRDDDTAGVAVSLLGPAQTNENGGATTIYLALTSQPTADVRIELASSRPSEGSLVTSSVLFTPSNWFTTQQIQVTGVNDEFVDGSQNYSVQFGPITSSDSKYAALIVPEVPLQNLDNDVAGAVVTPAGGLTTSEAGGGGSSFTVALTAQPQHDVLVPISSSHPTRVNTSVTSLLFTTANWQTPQTVIVTGVRDYVDAPDLPFEIQIGAFISLDESFAGIDPDDLTGTLVDVDTSGVQIMPTMGLVTTESGGTASFSVVLTSKPTAPVTISVASSDPAEGQVSSAVLTFAIDAWNVPKLVTITGVDDLLDDGNKLYQINLGPSMSADAKYDGLLLNSVSVASLDDGLHPGDSTPPTVASQLIQNGLTQRSFVDLISITFSDLVNLDELIGGGAITTAMTLTNLGLDPNLGIRTSVPIDVGQFSSSVDAITGQSILTWSLNHFGTGKASLADGMYELRLMGDQFKDAAGNPLDGAGLGLPSSNYVLYFHRLEGDANGDMQVMQNPDEEIVKAALNRRPGQPGYNPNADLDRDNVITTRDRLVVLRNTGRSIEPLIASGSSLSQAILATPSSVTDKGLQAWTETVSAVLVGRGDADWIKFVAPASGTLSVQATATNAIGSLETQILVMQSLVDGNVHPAIIESAIGTEQIITAVAGREYYFRIQSSAGDVESELAYNARIELKVFDDYLPLAGLDVARADFGVRGSGYSIAIIDTGIDYTQPALAGRVIKGPDFGDNDSDPMDTVGHGTHVAGIAGSADDYVPGVASDANLIAIKITHDGSLTTSLANILKALQWVIDHRAMYNIAAVNLSFGGGNAPKGTVVAALEPLYQELARQGVFVAVAAGNGGASYATTGLNLLATSTAVAAIGAVWDSNAGSVAFASGARDYQTAPDQIASFSQRAAGLDLLAPGGDIRNLALNSGLVVRSGTSMATPLVAGAAVLMRQLADNLGLVLSPQQILELLETSGQTILDADLGSDNVLHTNLMFSRINVGAALQSLTTQGHTANSTLEIAASSQDNVQQVEMLAEVFGIFTGVGSNVEAPSANSQTTVTPQPSPLPTTGESRRLPDDWADVADRFFAFTVGRARWESSRRDGAVATRPGMPDSWQSDGSGRRATPTQCLGAAELDADELQRRLHEEVFANLFAADNDDLTKSQTRELTSRQFGT